MDFPFDRIAGLNPEDVRALTLEDWGPVSPESVASGAPHQHGVVLVPGPTPDEGFGVWRCTPYVSVWMTWPAHEFVQLIDGTVTLETEDGSRTWKAGESFFIPAGQRLRWVQAEEVLKLYYIANAA